MTKASLPYTLSPAHEAWLHSFIGSIDEVFASELLDFAGLPSGEVSEYGPALTWTWQDYEFGYTFKVYMLADDLFVLHASSDYDACETAMDFEQLKAWVNNEAPHVTLGDEPQYFTRKWLEYEAQEAYFAQCERRAHCQ